MQWISKGKVPIIFGTDCFIKNYIQNINFPRIVISGTTCEKRRPIQAGLLSILSHK